jgi:uncharacterized RDD family membrane protein YckC
MLITLLMGVIPYIYSLDHENPYTTIVIFCKIRSYILQSNTMMCRWGLAAASFDRYALTSTNARLRNFATVRIARRVIAVIIIVWLLLPIQILVFFNLRQGRCGILYDVGVSLYFSSYTLITGSILPVSIMIICAVLVRSNLVLRRQRRRELTNNNPSNNEHSHHRRDQQVFAMLLLQALVYIMTQTPWMLLLFYSAATIYVSNRSADRMAIEGFLNFATELVIYLLPALSFYLYTLASRTFREELMKLLHFPVQRRQINVTNRIHPLKNEIPVRINIEPVHTLD